MASKRFPARIAALPPFEGPFDALQLEASGCRALFASYAAGAAVASHSHPTENCGVVTAGEPILETGSGEQRFGPGDWYHLAAGELHAARFEVATSEIEFWFET